MIAQSALSALVLSVLVLPGVCQKPKARAKHERARKVALTHKDYDAWRRISDTALSQDGRWIALSYVPADGDAELLLRQTAGNKRFVYPRGRGAKFTKDARFCVFLRYPSKADVEAYKERKKAKAKQKAEQAEKRPEGGKKPGKQKKPEPEDQEPKKALEFVDLVAKKCESFERVRSFRVPERGPNVLVYQLEPKSPERSSGGRSTPSRTRGRRGFRGRPTGAVAATSSGSTLVLYDLEGRKAIRSWPGVTRYSIADKKGLLWFVQAAEKPKPKKKPAKAKAPAKRDAQGKGKTATGQSGKKQKNDKKPAPVRKGGLFVVPLEDPSKVLCLREGPGDFKSIVFDKEQTRLAFLFQAERKAAAASKSKKPDSKADKAKHDTGPWDVYTWTFEGKRARRVLAGRKLSGFAGDHEISPDVSLRLSKDGSVAMLGVREIPKPPEEPIDAEDKVTLDIWHWKDPLLQPMQARRASQDRRRAISAALHFESGDLVELTQRDEGAPSFLTPDGSLAIWYDTLPYAQELSWDGRYSDVWVVRTHDGKRTRLLRRLRGRASASPSGRYVIYFGADNQWHSVDVDGGKDRVLTAGAGVHWEDELWDKPEPPRAYGSGGWVDREAFVLLYDRYDIWRAAPDGSSCVCVTDGVGRGRKISLRYVSEDREQETIDPAKRLLLSATNQETMASGYFEDWVTGVKQPRQLVMLDRAFGRSLIKAKAADRYVYSLSSFQHAPDLWTSKGTFQKPKRLTNVNPQQRRYRWGRAELVRWDSASGSPLKGILIKPDGFDRRKKYPLMVYIYERRSQGLHRYVRPAPGTSPNAAYYVSNGYLWFEPDIKYRVGYPGPSCRDCVIPGVLSLVKMGFVDEDAIGIAGHSWGGYQTAYLVTQTDLFKAVESGAPVSDMVSAYGGIRWGSGMSRMFQYEKTQSRLGGSLWDKPLRYFENSPVFFADKVNTPILMLHNDKDGAVPWYQGIEYFVALRRLGKEAYLFDYNGEDHGLRRRADQKDWTRRMQEFFDHHLRGRPAPEWMKKGVRYVDREAEKRKYLEPKTKPAERTELTNNSGKPESGN